MTEVARVNDEFRRVRKRIDLLDRRLKCTRHVGIGGLGKPDVTVADLNKTKFTLRTVRLLAERARAGHTTGYGPHYAGSGPSHALKKTATVDAIVVIVTNN